MIRRSKVSREHDLRFAEFLAGTAAQKFPHFKPDLVVPCQSAPDRRIASRASAASSRSGS
jgi:hypothetical protein